MKELAMLLKKDCISIFKSVSSTFFVKQSHSVRTRRIKTMNAISHSPDVCFESCTFGASQWHARYQIVGGNLFFNFARAAKPCLLTCFKMLILPTQKDFFARRTLLSRLLVAVEYLAKKRSFRKQDLKTTSTDLQ